MVAAALRRTRGRRARLAGHTRASPREKYSQRGASRRGRAGVIAVAAALAHAAVRARALDRRFADSTHPVQLSEGNALTIMMGPSRLPEMPNLAGASSSCTTGCAPPALPHNWVTLIYGWRLGLINSIAGSAARSVACGAPEAESQLCIDPHAVEL